MEKTATHAEHIGILPNANHSELVGILSKRVSEQEQKIGLLLEVLHYQNKAIKSCKAIDSGHMENATAADICISEILADALNLSDKADEEAA